jgi:glycosyltransferase involved in cell wall biosynthesis
MIVKNEMANLDRCLASIADHISCWVIADTGSTDGTQTFIQDYFDKRNIPGELHAIPFDNFEQARNEALELAYASPVKYDYLLFTDADMELVVEDRTFRHRLEAPGYRLIQRAGSELSYWNVRLVKRGLGARYYGVTHEYLDVPGDVRELRGIWFNDHASGSNRVHKFERDIRLLLDGLKRDPENARYYFYLAQSQLDAGLYAEAAATYARRAAMGGWDEEAWYARLQQARCLLALKDEAGFLREAMVAFNRRPQRAEPLYDLARYYRERSMNDASVLFCEAGLALPPPGEDILFIDDSVYATGLLEEYSIVANYSNDPDRKERGHAACEYLTLSRNAPQRTRDLARSNLRFYIEQASAIMPSFNPRPVGFASPDGYHPMNPSITRCRDALFLNQRVVNFTLTGTNYSTQSDAPVHTRNFLLHLNAELDVERSWEILPPQDLPPPQFHEVRGFEDMRLIEWRSELWCVSNVRELLEQGWCQQVLARIEESTDDSCVLTDWSVISDPGRHEKNWMPQVEGNRLRFIYSCDPTQLMDEYGELITETKSPLQGDAFRGGSQAVSFDDGWLTLVHEVCFATNQRIYMHRFVWFDDASFLQKVSRAFYFVEKGIEFAAGMAWHSNGKHLLISFGVADSQSWIAMVEAADVHRLLEDAEGRASGALPPNTTLCAPASKSDHMAALPRETAKRHG